jgi:predicted DNA binding CopG/RHH family protein
MKETYIQSFEKMAKDTALNIRISSQDLELVKKAAMDNGYDKYSEWCLSILLSAANKTSVLDEVETLKQRVDKLEKLIPV